MARSPDQIEADLDAGTLSLSDVERDLSILREWQEELEQRERTLSEAARRERERARADLDAGIPVSYTHLTLPTIYSV